MSIIFNEFIYNEEYIINKTKGKYTNRPGSLTGIDSGPFGASAF
jgi:hypothetical protein